MRGPRLGLQSAVLAAEIEKRLAIANCSGFHFAQKDSVITRKIFRDDITGELRQRIFKDRDTSSRPTITDAEVRVGIGALFSGCKMAGEGLLRILENAYAEAALRFEEREQTAFFIHADGDQRRVKGNRVEGVSGHAMDLARLALDSDHGDAGGEMTHDAAEELGCD